MQQLQQQLQQNAQNAQNNTIKQEQQQQANKGPDQQQQAQQITGGTLFANNTLNQGMINCIFFAWRKDYFIKMQRALGKIVE